MCGVCCKNNKKKFEIENIELCYHCFRICNKYYKI